MAETFQSELFDPPDYEPGDKVRALRAVRNDGTYYGVPMGGFLIKGGEIGYVKSVGTYLNRFYVYGIEFPDAAIVVGMRRHEIEPMENPL